MAKLKPEPQDHTQEAAAGLPAVFDESPPESEPADRKPDDVPAESASGIYVYVGPTIMGKIQSGMIFSGGRARALTLCADAIARCPGVKRLIVPAERLAETRENIRLKKGLAYRVYRDLAAEPSK
jgi:hypothetical protein